MSRALLAAADGDTAAAVVCRRRCVSMQILDRRRSLHAGPDHCAGTRSGDGKVVLEMALSCPKTGGVLVIQTIGRRCWAPISRR